MNRRKEKRLLKRIADNPCISRFLKVISLHPDQIGEEESFKRIMLFIAEHYPLCPKKRPNTRFQAFLTEAFQIGFERQMIAELWK